MPILMGISGIPGSCGIQGYSDWMELSAFAWGGTRGTLQQRSADRRSISTLAASPQLRAVKAVRESDHVTPELWELMLGLSKKTVAFTWLRTGPDGPIPYLKLTLTNALITSMAEDADGGSPVETMQFTYEKLTLTVVNVGDSLRGPQDIVTYDLPQALRG
jgi:type VI protein secretion system component Hcp